ncbi:MAG: rRNA adenine N-6-methyltransferase family protein [Nitrospira sp.]
MENILFIHKFLKNWREIGSVAPSSKFLVEKMVQPVDFDNALVIVEFGPGSGCITKELLRKMRKDAKLIVFETNKDFYRDLHKIKDSRITIYNESAVNLEKHLGQNSVDVIVSGIPLAVLKNKDKFSLLKSSYNSLVSGGKYIQFQYSLESQKELEDTFGSISIDFTPLNIPPAFVFSCLKK